MLTMLKITIVNIVKIKFKKGLKSYLSIYTNI